MSDPTQPSERAKAHHYPIVYHVEFPEGGLTPAEIEARPDRAELGACDALLIASILYPPDGSLSVLFIGQDGRTKGELDDIEWFKVWSMLASRLAQSRTLDPSRKALAEMTFDLIRAAILAGRADNPEHP